MADYAENILEAIELLTDKKIQNAGFDKTIKATVTTVKGNGIYVCNFESLNFSAYGTEAAYQEGDIVMVNIPENNWSNPKTIINKVYYETIDNKSLNPLDDFICIGNNTFYINTEEAGVKANVRQYSTYTLADLNNLEYYTEPFTRLALKVSLKSTVGQGYSVKKGTYGIKITLSANNLPLFVYTYDTEDFFGNIYNFNDYTPQTLLLTLDPEILNQADNMKVELFQSNDFYILNEYGQEVELSYSEQLTPEEIPYNIFSSDLKMYYGLGKNEIQDGDFVLTSPSNVYYYKDWSVEENRKEFKGYFYYIDANGVYRKIEVSDDGVSTFVYRDLNNVERTIEFLLQKNYNGIWTDVLYYDPRTDEDSLLKYYDELTEAVQLESEEIQYRIKFNYFKIDDKNESTLRFSNIVSFFRFQPTSSTLEDDKQFAIKSEYWYYDGSNYHNTIKYNKMENQLCSQEESYAPHFIFLKWDPKTPELQEDDYLRGAKVTWKIPACNLDNEQEYNKVDFANYRFLEEKKSIIQHPKPFYSYYCLNETVRYEDVEGVNCFCWDVELPDDFLYSEHLTKVLDTFKKDVTIINQRTILKSNEIFHREEEFWTARGLILCFQIKEYYLPKMTNNFIICNIEDKNGNIFETKIELPIENVDTLETNNKSFILTENFEKPDLKGSTTTKNFLPNQVLHFSTYRNNYANREYYGENIHILRPERPLVDEDKIDSRFLVDDSPDIPPQDLTKICHVTGRDIDEDLYFFNIDPSQRWSHTGNYRPFKLFFATISWDGVPVEMDWEVKICAFDILQSDAQKEEYLQDFGTTYGIRDVLFYDCNGYTVACAHLYTAFEDGGWDFHPTVFSDFNPNVIIFNHTEGTTKLNFQELVENDLMPYLRENLDQWISYESYPSNIFKEGYWYYNDNNELEESQPEIDSEIQLKWYSLIPSSLLNLDRYYYEYLMLQTENDGIDSIINISYNSYVQHSSYGTGFYTYDKKYLLSGIDRLYFGSEGLLRENTYGPDNIPYNLKKIFFPGDNLISYPESSNSLDVNYFVVTVKSTQEGYGFTEQFYEGQNGKKYNFTPELRTQTLKYSDEDDVEQEEEQLFLRYNQVGFTKNYSKVGWSIYHPAYQVRSNNMIDESQQVFYATLPVVFQQRQIYRDDFTEWDGTKVQIGDDAVYSPVIGAGTKSANKFTGVLMGDIARIDSGVSRRSLGLYGYKNDEQVFGLKADGTMFLGKNGDGQLLFDGNKATIQSRSYSENHKKGMLIDFDDGIIDMENSEGLSQDQINELIDIQADKVDVDARVLTSSLNDLYNNSYIYDYVKVGNDESYNDEITYYTFSDETLPRQSLTYYRYLKVDKLEAGNEYFRRLRNSSEIPTSYIPVTDEEAYIKNEAADADPDIIYYLRYPTGEPDEYEYVAQPFPLTDLGGFDPNLDYYYREYYYYEPLNYQNIFVPDNDDEAFNYTVYEWEGNASTWDADKYLLYRKEIAILPNGNDGPEWGYSIRVYGGLVDRFPTSDTKKYYYYAFPSYEQVSTSGSPDQQTTYYKIVNGQYVAQSVPLAAFEPDTDYYILREGKYDIIIYQDEKWVNRFTAITSLTQFNNYAYLTDDKDVTCTTLNTRNNDNTVITDWDNKIAQRENDYIVLTNSITGLEDEIDTAKVKTDNYELAYGNFYRIKQQYQPEDPEYIEAEEAYELAYDIYCDIDDDTEAVADIMREANTNISITHRIDFRNSFMRQLCYPTPDYQTLNDILYNYDRNYSTYKADKDLLEEYRQMSPYQSTPYGIKLDSSDANIYNSSHEIDLSKFPLKIGELSQPSFTVNWKGEMTSTAGLIGGWKIEPNKLSATNSSGKLILSSSSSDKPLVIGNGFSVNWDGTVNAKDIKIEGGTLSGTIKAATGTTIKNVTIVNNNGTGLKWSGNNLLLDGGIILGSGSSITGNNSTITANNVVVKNSFLLAGLRWRMHTIKTKDLSGSEITLTVLASS